jgi:hypothetical protein
MRFDPFTLETFLQLYPLSLATIISDPTTIKTGINNRKKAPMAQKKIKKKIRKIKHSNLQQKYRPPLTQYRTPGFCRFVKHKTRN